MANDNQSSDIRKIVVTSLFAALIAVGSYMMIPLPWSPVPVALQSFFILLAGLLLGKTWGTVSVSIFLLAGIIGFPVFSGARGGLAHFAGPTGGYLISYIPAVFCTGLLSRLPSIKRIRNKSLRTIPPLLAGTLIIYIFGVSWLAFLKLNLVAAIGIGLLPFIPGDILKIILASFIAPKLSELMDTRESGSDSEP